jgi:hypothetical protein
MKFNIKDYKGKLAMHCKTAEEAKDFCHYMSGIDNDKWRYFLIHTCYNVYKSNTTYNVRLGLYGDLNDFSKKDYTILEWSDFMNKEFTKADLKTGDVVQRRNGKIGIVNCELGTIISKDGYSNLDNMRSNLTAPDEQWDIVAVRRPQAKNHCQFSAFACEYGELVYERKEPEEMTLAEVCRLLGKEIKIVK